MPNGRLQVHSLEQRETRAIKNEGPTHWSGLRVKREVWQISSSGLPDRPIRLPAEIERPRHR